MLPSNLALLLMTLVDFLAYGLARNAFLLRLLYFLCTNVYP